jgi:Helicase HerA, central domain
MMNEFEKMGVFYLGKEYDIESKKLSEDLVLYKSKDLTTHAMIIGMTGSGKTGLGISMIEEAALDNIPVIAIDPKGDLGNLALTFPQLRKDDFLPWINASEAANKGLSSDTFAQAQADLWSKGLSSWGQDGQRIQKFKDAADVLVYTPGSSSGIGVSVLKSFHAPSQAIINDFDAYRDRLDVTTTSLLALIGISGNTFTSREVVVTSRRSR